MSNESVPTRALSIHAHPDDQEFTVAGTLAKWAKAGCEIVSVCITSGDSGSNDEAHDASHKSQLARIREAEQRAANAVLGIKEAVFLGYPDGELEPSLELRKELTRLIRKYKPDVVLTGDPQAWFYGNDYINHPDHRAAAQATCEAVFPSAGTRLIFTDLLEAGYEPHEIKCLFIHGVEKPDTWVDIAETIDLKLTALKKHVSQVGQEDLDKLIRRWAAEEGQAAGLACAEAFRVMSLVREEDRGCFSPARRF
jgi:LmbE family N-acetylglucosaminyl deacetylase